MITPQTTGSPARTENPAQTDLQAGPIVPRDYSHCKAVACPFCAAVAWGLTCEKGRRPADCKADHHAEQQIFRSLRRASLRCNSGDGPCDRMEECTTDPDGCEWEGYAADERERRHQTNDWGR